MSNKTQLQTNNTKLDALITRVNTAKDTAASLPEAGSGGGGSIETCTVTVMRDESYAILGVRVENSIPVPFYSEDTPNTRTWETVCESVVVVSSPWSLGYDCSNATFIGNMLDYTSNGTMFYNLNMYVFRIDAQPGETASIYVYEA
jgi:hypothetical protein